MKNLIPKEFHVNLLIYGVVCSLFGISSIINSILFEFSKISILFWISLGSFLGFFYGIQKILPSKINVLMVVMAFAIGISSGLISICFNTYRDILTTLFIYSMIFIIICSAGFPISFLKERIRIIKSPFQDVEIDEQKTNRHQIKSTFQLICIISLYSLLVTTIIFIEQLF